MSWQIGTNTSLIKLPIWQMGYNTIIKNQEPNTEPCGISSLQLMCHVWLWIGISVKEIHWYSHTYERSLWVQRRLERIFLEAELTLQALDFRSLTTESAQVEFCNENQESIWTPVTWYRVITYKEVAQYGRIHPQSFSQNHRT